MSRSTAPALALFAAATLALTWPVWADPAGLRMGAGADPSLYIWTIGWTTHALTHAPWAIFDANIFFPHPHTLAYSEHLIGSSLLALPVMWLTGDAQVATNLVSVLTVFLCAVGGWFLARTLGLPPAAAVLAGLIFAFAPPRFARLAQLHLTAVQWMPFALAFLHRYQDHGRPRDLKLMLAAFSLQAITSGHGAALTLLGLSVMSGFRLAGGWAFTPVTWLRDAGPAGVAALLPAVASFVPYWLARQTVTLDRVHDDAGVTVVSYLSSPSHVHQWLLDRLPNWAWTEQWPDAHLFPGVLVLLLALIGVCRPTPWRWMWAGMVGLTWWMTLGPPWSIWGWIYWMPGLNFIRVPSRFTVLGVLALAVLAAWGFQRVTDGWSRARLGWATTLCATLVLVECVMPVDARPFRPDTAAVDHWLAGQPTPFAVAEVPVSGSRDPSRRADVAVQYMLHTLAHHQPTVFGFSGAEPPDYRAMYEQELMTFPSDDSVTRLIARGVTYVVVHLEYFTEQARPAFEARLAAFPERLTLVHADGLGRVYRLNR